ncbi:MAG: glycosyltransferase family 2 protein [Bacteroides sp.]|nr:glycosyltransferase family 2 protein [Bacteroides sp.]
MCIVKNWFEQRLHEEGLSAEELIQAESQIQAADQLSVSHSIKSFRFINNTDWRNFVENISFVEYILRGDPMQLYAAMDFNSRDQYRHRIEKLARQSHYSEEEVARKAIEMTQEAYRQEGAEKRTTHVGYYLVDEGADRLAATLGIKRSRKTRFARFLKTYPLVFYTGTILLISILGTLLFAHLVKSSGASITYGNLVLVSICFFFFLSQFSVFLVNYLSTLWVSPDFLPRLDFSTGIPHSCRTVFVVPAMISDKESVQKLLMDIEIHYLSNPDSSLTFALLTDFADADHQQEPRDNELLEQIRSEIESLNHKYGSDTNSLFFLFHRPRRWDAAEKKWMAYERKRGKLMAFNTFLTEGITTLLMLTEGNLETLTGVKYVITLDADTQLPPYSAYKLVGTMAHILNQPIIDPERHIVTKGYGILQPRVAINLRSSLFSWYSRLFTNEVGIDPYTRSVSDVYQDIFHVGSFVGKGIYDVKTFETVLARRFPENTILSHDLLESTYVRSGLLADVEMYESYPGTYVADAKRRHRWMRGDWQIIQWLFSKVPTLTGKEPNPLSGLSKWKIADNLRRTLVSPLALLFLTGAFAWFPRKAWIAVVILLIVAFLPFFITFPIGLFRKSKEESWLLHLQDV